MLRILTPVVAPAQVVAPARTNNIFSLQGAAPARGGPGTGGGPGAHEQYFFFAGGGPRARGLDKHDQSMYTTLFVVRPTLRFTILPHLSFC
jgi:hypothetical protein